MTKKSTTEKTSTPVKKKVVFYAVNNKNSDAVADDEIYLYDSLEDAYKDHIQNDGINGEKLYAYKIEYMGEIKMELNIKP